MSSDKWFVVAVVAFMVVLGCVVMAVRNARYNARRRADEEMEAWPATAVLPVGQDRLPRQAGGDNRPGSDRDEGPAGHGHLSVSDVPQMAFDDAAPELDEQWADQLAQMNAEHLLTPAQSDETRVMEEGWFDAWEADQAAWVQAWRDAGDDTDMWLAHGMAGVEGEWPPYTMAAQIHTERMVTA